MLVHGYVLCYISLHYLEIQMVAATLGDIVLCGAKSDNCRLYNKKRGTRKITIYGNAATRPVVVELRNIGAIRMDDSCWWFALLVLNWLLKLARFKATCPNNRLSVLHYKKFRWSLWLRPIFFNGYLLQWNLSINKASWYVLFNWKLFYLNFSVLWFITVSCECDTSDKIFSQKLCCRNLYQDR